MAAELIVDAGKPKWNNFDKATLDDVLESLTIRARDEPDFWSFIGMIELRTYQAIADKGLAAARPDIERDLDELFTRVSAASMWSSVLDQASFVLPKYAQRAGGVERQAATRLLARVRGYVRESGGYENFRVKRADHSLCEFAFVILRAQIGANTSVSADCIDGTAACWLKLL